MTGDTLIVDDDGDGPAIADAVPGNGLRGLTERARAGAGPRRGVRRARSAGTACS